MCEKRALGSYHIKKKICAGLKHRYIMFKKYTGDFKPKTLRPNLMEIKSLCSSQFECCTKKKQFLQNESIKEMRQTQKNPLILSYIFIKRQKKPYLEGLPKDYCNFNEISRIAVVNNLRKVFGGETSLLVLLEMWGGKINKTTDPFLITKSWRVGGNANAYTIPEM